VSMAEWPSGGWKPYPSFEISARALVGQIRAQLGAASAVLVEMTGEGWRLTAEDHDPASPITVSAGDLIATGASGLPLLTSALGPSAATAESFVSIPLLGGDGTVRALLMALGGRSAPGAEVGADAFEIPARLLASLLEWRDHSADYDRRVQVELLSEDADGDFGVMRSGAWRALVAAEDERCRATSRPVSIVVVNVAPADGMGTADPHDMAVAAKHLVRYVRPTDVVGRIGKERLGVLAVDLSAEHAEAVSRRLRDHLVDAALNVELSWFSRTSEMGLIAGLNQLLRARGEQVRQFLRCGQCGRHGAYVSSRFPIIRCKYCRATAPLEG